MSNKDIDRLKELQSTIYEGGDYIYLNKNDKQALGNVLTEFQGLRDFSTETVRRNADLQEELETYKNEIKKYKHSMAMISEICIDESKVHITTREAIEEIRKYIYHGVDIDWARREVNKNEKTNI